MRLLESWGLRPELGAAAFAGAAHGFLAADDDARLADLHDAWADDEVAGVLALRGGYGSQRLVDAINWDLIAARPKLFCGFSDCTALHLALRQRAGLVTLHGPNVASDPLRLGETAAAWWRGLLFGSQPAGTLPARGICVISGVAEGPVAGGNLSLLCASVGTLDHPRLAGAIVLVEDVGERPYAVDRALWHLRRSGVLDGIAGLVLDVFHGCEAPSGSPSMRTADVLAEHAEALDVPAVCGLPLGHGPGQLAVPFGPRARLDAGEGVITLLDAAFR